MLDAHLERSDGRRDAVKALLEQANRLLHSSPSHTDVADLRARLERLPPRELVRFESQSRSWLSSKAIAHLRWPRLRGGREALGSVLGLVSGDGRERERAAKAAGLTPLTARLLAIRCTDWVAEVRDPASERLEQCPAPLLVELLALADQLAPERLRGDALDALLDTRLSDEDLGGATRADDRHIRRAAWRRLIVPGRAGLRRASRCRRTG